MNNASRFQRTKKHAAFEKQKDLKPMHGEEYGYVLTKMPRFVLEDILKQSQRPWRFVETSLFIYNHNKDEEDNYA